MAEWVVLYEDNAFDVDTPREAAEQVARKLAGYAGRAIYDVVSTDGGFIHRIDLTEESE